jgi:hypothetical protein
MDGNEKAYGAAIEEIRDIIHEPNIIMASARRRISRVLVDLRKETGEEEPPVILRATKPPARRR